jgi:hypothetical protein
LYVKSCKANDQQANAKIEGHAQKVGRHGELFEKNLTEPHKQQPKYILEYNGKMGRAQYKPHVGLNLFDVFFKVLSDLCCEKPGDEISDKNGPYLQKAAGMKKILGKPLIQ